MLDIIEPVEQALILEGITTVSELVRQLRDFLTRYGDKFIVLSNGYPLRTGPRLFYVSHHDVSVLACLIANEYSEWSGQPFSDDYVLPVAFRGLLPPPVSL